MINSHLGMPWICYMYISLLFVTDSYQKKEQLNLKNLLETFNHRGRCRHFF